MNYFKIIQKGYKIYIFKNSYNLNISIKGEKREEKVRNKFNHIQINLNDNFNEFLSNFEDIFKQIKDKNLIIILEEVFDTSKTYIKYLNFKIIKKDFNDNETKEIISKKIYVLNTEYYLTKGPNHKRINSLPFFTYIKKDYFNIEDIINFINEDDILQLYNIDEYKYFNGELGCFIDIKDEYIQIKEKLILELHIFEKKDVIKYNLNQIKKYFDEEIITMKNRITVLDYIY